LQAAGLPVLEAVCFFLRDYLRGRDAYLDRIEQVCGYPVIVKPVNLGSSVGIGLAQNRDRLMAAIDHAGGFAHRILCERAVTNLREINCAVLGDSEHPIPSLCEEPTAGGEILSYADKYLAGGKGEDGKTGASGMAGASRRLPADIPSDMESRIKALAVDAFRALGCSGVVRCDFLVDMDEAGGTVYLNEVNTIPGSLSYYLFAPAGLAYPALLDRLIDLAFKRQRERDGLTFSFETNLFDVKGTGMLKTSKGGKG